ncbi:MAG: adenylate/guanylate cyclase domain-containing protein [Actinomycetaceae bacterium]|nr:adenylate/guanylate cyclase domain-containing protein [Actinomycetaceae bacterium]
MSGSRSDDEDPAHTGSGPSNTVQRNVERLLKGPTPYTLAEAAQAAGLDVEAARKFWLSMGFPNIRQDSQTRAFGDYDVQAMRAHGQALASGKFTPETLESLNRAQSHMADRLVWWQHEVLVEYARIELGLDGISARYWVLDRISEYEDYLRSQIEYSWRRHMTFLLRRSEAEVGQMDPDDASNVTLQRAFGFIDMVAFTNRSNELGSADFIKLIEEFDYTCREVIHTNGARVVKTIGDAFLYIADDVVTGAEVATNIIEELREVEGMLPVRASLVWGGVVSRFGDIFGPKVNLASRLVDVADSGVVMTDKETAEILRSLKLGRYTLVPAGSPTLQGFGRIDAIELRRVPTSRSSQ